MSTTPKPTLYASLIGPLLGCYYPLPFDDERKARVAINTSKLKALWCACYTEAEVDDQIARWGGTKLPASMAGSLDYDSAVVNDPNTGAW